MKRMDSINVVPLIDIMLVLLAIVLTTASFIHYGRIDVNLPETDTPVTGDVSDATVIVVDRNGNLHLDDGPVDIEGLGAHLDRLQASDSVVLKVDRDAAFGNFAGVVGQLKARSLNRLSILVDSGD